MADETTLIELLRSQITHFQARLTVLEGEVVALKTKVANMPQGAQPVGPPLVLPQWRGGKPDVSILRDMERSKE
jgi:hypothetical protein